MKDRCWLVDEVEGVDLLQMIGEDLDQDLVPLVHEGGQVEPGPHRPRGTSPGERYSQPFEEVNQDVRRGQREGSADFRSGSGRGSARAAPGEGERSSQRGAPARQGSQAQEASVLLPSGLGDSIRDDLQEAAGAYPQMRIRPAPENLWISLWFWPIRGLREGAVMITKYPLDAPTYPRSWAWWDTGVWIGPRHTNVPDGSICSFEIPDHTWRPGDALLDLIDLNVLWVVRHLHLRHFGWWPGRQVIHTSYERLLEQNPRELCGCDSRASYKECCLPGDRRTWLRGLAKYWVRFRSFERNPGRVFGPDRGPGVRQLVAPA